MPAVLRDTDAGVGWPTVGAGLAFHRLAADGTMQHWIFDGENAIIHVVMTRLPLIKRALLTFMLLASWTVTTSHCALAAATTAISTAVVADDENFSDQCPMHSAKTAKHGTPEKKKGCADLPCCKNLPAAKPLPGTSASKAPIVLLTLHCARSCEQLELSRPAELPIALDTGPPEPNN